jgi:hypothetical protein
LSIDAAVRVCNQLDPREIVEGPRNRPDQTAAPREHDHALVKPVLGPAIDRNHSLEPGSIFGHHVRDQELVLGPRLLDPYGSLELADTLLSTLLSRDRVLKLFDLVAQILVFLDDIPPVCDAFEEIIHGSGNIA